MKSIRIKITAMAAFVAAFLPQFASAQTGGQGLFGVLEKANQLISMLLPFVITLTLLVFLWGIFKYVVSGGDMEARKQARGFIIWGLVALAVMVSVWGLVNLLIRTVGVDNTPPPAPHGIDVQGGIQVRP
jgi:hypothetical protein